MTSSDKLSRSAKFVWPVTSKMAARERLERMVIQLVVARPADPNRKCTCAAPPAGTVTFCRCRGDDAKETASVRKENREELRN